MSPKGRLAALDLHRVNHRRTLRLEGLWTWVSKDVVVGGGLFWGWIGHAISCICRCFVVLFSSIHSYLCLVVSIQLFLSNSSLYVGSVVQLSDEIALPMIIFADNTSLILCALYVELSDSRKPSASSRLAVVIFESFVSTVRLSLYLFNLILFVLFLFTPWACGICPG